MSGIQKKVIGVGSPVVDLLAQVSEDELSQIPGKKGGMELIDQQVMVEILKILGSDPVRAAGGSAGNTTFVLARLGMQAAILGKLGEDENGIFYRDAFGRLGGDVTRFKVDPAAPTACCISLVTPDGERTMRTHLGAAMLMAGDDVSVEDFKGYAHVHAEGYLFFNRDLMEKVVRNAKAAGCTVSFDLGSFEVVNAAHDILEDVLGEYVDLVFANEEEAEAFSGKKDPSEGLAVLSSLCRVAAVKLGAKGALITDGSGTVTVPAQKVDHVVDTTGAGDFWAAGFLFGYLNGYGLEAAGRMGAVLGSHVVQQLGAELPESEWPAVVEDVNGIAG